MIRLWFVTAALLFLTLSLLAALALTLGTTQPPNPALADFGFCSGAPCYIGIDLQTADMNAANDSLVTGGYQGNVASGFYRSLDNRCDVILYTDVYGDEVISGLRLTECRDLRIGELIELLGTPDHVLMSDFCDWVLEYSRRTFVHIAGRDLLLPTNRVTQVNFVRASSLIPTSPRWHGFTMLWRYQQYEPEVSFGTRCD